MPTGRTSLITDPLNGRLPQLTSEALARITSVENRRIFDAREGLAPAHGPEDMGLSERGLWYRGIPTFPTGYNNNYHIVQNPDFILILQEHIHDLRVIPLDGRPHLPPNIQQFAGSSRGHWEGDTLVVETSNFSPKSSFRGSGENLHLVERFTRLAPDTLEHEVTITDKNTWTSPWTVRLILKETQDPIFEYACHEGNYSMEGILAGARAEERDTTAGSR